MVRYLITEGTGSVEFNLADHILKEGDKSGRLKYEQNHKLFDKVSSTRWS